MLQTTSTERRAAGGDRPRSGGSVKMRPVCHPMGEHRAATRIAQRGGGNPIAWANQFPLPLLRPGVKSTTLFENDGRYVRLHHRQTSGNPVRIGDGCATVTNYKLPRPLVSSRDREGGSEA